MHDAVSAWNAGFIRQVCNQRVLLPDKSGVPVVVSRCVPGDGKEFTFHVSRFRLASRLPPTNASRMENPGQFRELFRMQKALNERIGVKTGGMSEEEKTKWILLKSTSKHALERKVR